MNPYDQLMEQMMRSRPLQNPMQEANYILQAMRNPPAFIKERFPDIPDDIANDPNLILSYLQKTRGITNDQIQQIMQLYPNPMMMGR